MKIALMRRRISARSRWLAASRAEVVMGLLGNRRGAVTELSSPHGRSKSSQSIAALRNFRPCRSAPRPCRSAPEYRSSARDTRLLRRYVEAFDDLAPFFGVGAHARSEFVRRR